MTTKRLTKNGDETSRNRADGSNPKVQVTATSAPLRQFVQAGSSIGLGGLSDEAFPDDGLFICR